MSSVQITLFVAAGCGFIGLVVAAIASIVGAFRRNPPLERRAASCLVASFFVTMPLLIAACSNDWKPAVFGLPIVAILGGALFRTRPHCARCGEALSILTNRTLHRARCGFCGHAIEEGGGVYLY